MFETIKEFLLEQIKINQFLQGGVILTAGSYLLYQIKDIPERAWERIKRKIMFTTTIEETDELYVFFEKWLSKHHAQSYRRVEASLQEIVKKGDEYEEDGKNSEISKDELFFKQYDDTFFIFFEGLPLSIEKGREKLENANNLFNLFHNRFSISGYFAKNRIKRLLNKVIEYNQQFKKQVMNIYANDGYGSWRTITDVAIKNLENIVLPHKDSIIKDFNKFTQAELWYKDRAVPYKRGYLFYGQAGNGKTTLCLSLAKHLKRHIYFLNLDGVDNEGIKQLTEDLKPSSILVIEDVDSAFVKRKSENAKVTFSHILNYLDGVFYKQGVINILTTNHPELLDEALIRSGRIDYKIKIDNPTKELVEEYLQGFYGKPCKLSTYSMGYCMSDIQNICMDHQRDVGKAIELIGGKTKASKHRVTQI